MTKGNKMEEIIGWEYHKSNGDGSVRVVKFKTLESAEAYAEAYENSDYFEGFCDAGPYPVKLSDYADHEFEQY